MHDVIIIGAGAAGLGAAMYLLGKECDVLITSRQLGGKAGQHQELARAHTEEYIPGEEAVSVFAHYVGSRAGCVLRDDVVDVSEFHNGFRVDTTRHGQHTARAVIVATGVSPIPLQAPGANRLLGYGLGYSSTTHRRLVAGRTVAVVGSTERALRGALELAQTANRVVLVTPAAKLPPTALGQAVAACQTISVFLEHEVAELVGTTHVEALIVAGNIDRRTIHLDAVFVDLGLVPHTAMVRGLVRTDSEGRILVNAEHATTHPGIFAAGDITSEPCEQVLIALGAGAQAAVHTYEYLLCH